MKQLYFNLKTVSLADPKVFAAWILFVLLLVAGKLPAQVAGPNNPTTATLVTTIGTNNWNNVNNIFQINDGQYSQVSLSNGQISRYLRAGNFGFAVPANSVINGIEVRIHRMGNISSGGIIDNVVTLVKGTAIVGANKANTGTIWNTSFETITYGGPTDLWGTTWTADEINSVLATQISVRSTANSRVAYVDNIRITVYFTPPPVLSSFSNSPAPCYGQSVPVTINGNHLATATSVSFNGIAATFTVDSNNQITAQSPATATSGPISVTTPSGTVTSAVNYIVNPLPAISPNAGDSSVCAGSQITLSNATAGGVWNSSSPSIASINTSGVVTGISAGNVTITYTITDTNGCSSQQSHNVIVNPLPVTSSAATLCEGQVFQLSPSNGGTWTSSNPATATVSSSGLVTGVSAGSATFTFTNAVTGCSNTTPAVQVYPIPVIDLQPSAQEVCSGSSAVFAISATGTALDYQWFNGASALVDGVNISGANTPTLTLTNIQVSQASANYHCVVTSVCSESVSSANASLTVIDRVQITTQPAANLTGCENGSLQLTVGATGSGLTYQWYKGAAMLTDNSNISGSDSATLTLSNLSPADAGEYSVVVSGISPCPQVVSQPATVVVSSAPAITQQPQPQTVCSGTTTILQVDATGAGLSYQWYSNGIPLANGGNISGANSATLTINPTGISDQSNYYALITGSCSPVATTNTVSLTVNEAVSITAQPLTAQSVCTGETATFTVSASGSGLSYQWYRGATLLTDGGAISGANTATLSINPVGAGHAANNYRVVVSGTSPCVAVTSNYAALTVNQSPAITTQPVASLSRCSGQSATFTVGATGGTLTYQWYFNGNPLSDGGAINGATSSALSINPVQVTDAGQYHCVVGNPCLNDAVSNFAMLTVNQRPIVPAQSVTICSGDSYTISPQNGVPDASVVIPANTVYSWAASTGAGITGGQAQSQQPEIFGTLNNITNTVRSITFNVTPLNTDGSCSGSAFSVTVTVNPRPAIQNMVRNVCNGQTITITPANGGGNIVPAGTTYSWPAPVVTGGMTGGSAGSGLTSLSQTLINNTPAVQTATYTITPSTANCTGTPFTLTVTVNPAPAATVSLGSQTICSGSAIAPFLVTDSNAVPCNVQFNWVRDNTSAVTGTASGGATIASGGTYSFTPVLNNTTALPQTVTFTITPSTNGIPGTPVTATVTVLAPSAGGSATVSGPGIMPLVTVATVCHFASGTINLQNQTGSVIRWESSTTGGAVWTPIAHTGTSYNYVDLAVTTLFRAVVQNGNCATVNSQVAIVNVVPNVKPSPVTATPQTICVGQSSVLNSQSGYATSSQLAAGGAFQFANPAGWLVDGCGNCLSAGGSSSGPGPFQLSATNGGIYSGINYSATGKFAIANGAFDSVLETPVFNTFGLTSASLQFNHAFNLLAGAWVRVELSLDGGATYGITLQQWNGALTRTPYNNFPLSNLSLNNYIGQGNLKVRFVYHGVGASSWAIDNIRIPEMPSNLTTQWIDLATDSVISTSATLTVSPTVTTTYAITSSLNGCTSYGPEGTTYITVYVNERPTAVIGSDQTICLGGIATFSVALTGVAPWSLTYSNGTTSTTVNNIMANPYIFSVPNVMVNQTYTITSLSDSRCNAQPADMTGQAVVTVLNGQQGLWTGLVSNDWFDCMNWAGGLPDANVDATIPAGMPRMPVINPSASAFAASFSNIAAARDVIISTGASLTMPAVNSNLEVSRDWRNSGTFNSGLGTVVFNGSGAGQVQNINLGIKNNEQFYNMTIHAGAAALGVSVVDGFELTVANHITLTAGDLRLTGEAQLVQMGTTANPSAGSGRLLRDQQGTQSSFNYNYWSSPVSANNTNYTVGSVLRDGSNSASNPFNPGTINFGNGVYFADGVLASPIKISNSWINKFTSVSNDYYSWQFIGSSGTVKVGEGFTMKGTSGSADVNDLQNYTFAGKPNNGNITLSIAPGQSYLVGNPYPSALDADQFIRDNIMDGGNAASNVFTGALYFWDHFGGQTHLVSGYVGGYATYTLLGGVVAIANNPLNINDGSMGSKVPTRYIAVGQAFFIGTVTDPALSTNNPGLSSPITGGPVVFNNAQRTFRTEANGSVFFRAQNNFTSSLPQDGRMKLRLHYSGPGGLHRQLLAGADPNASMGFDLGYDAPMIDVGADDMYFAIDSGKLSIQAVESFNSGTILPIGIKVTNNGVSTIALGEVENMQGLTPFIHDNITGIYYNLSQSDANLNLSPGEYSGRFSLVFSSSSLGIDITKGGMSGIVYNDDMKILQIRTQAEITNVVLFDMAGRKVSELKYNSSEGGYQAQIGTVASGTYIIKAQTNGGILTQKILVGKP